MGSHNYVPSSVAGKLESPHCQWCRYNTKATGSKPKKNWVFSWCSSSKAARQKKFHLTQPFCSSEPSTDRTRPTHIKEGNLYYSVYYQFKFNFIWKHPHRYTRNNVWPNTWVPCNSVKLTGEINHRTFPIIAQLVLPADLWSRSLGLKASDILPQSLLAPYFWHVTKVG